MGDIVERMRAWEPMVSSGYECPAAGQAMHEAAAEIERLRAALEFYADRSFDGYETFVENYGMTVRGGAIIEDAGAIARAALAQEKQ